MRLARWIGISALAAGLAFGWNLVRGQSDPPLKLPPLPVVTPPPPRALPELPKTAELPAALTPDIKIAPPPAESRPRLPDQPETPATGKSPTVVSGDNRSRQEPVVSIEWLGPQTIRVNQPLACQILVRNTGPVAVQDVVVKHKLGAGVTVRQTEPQAFNDNGELVWTVGALQPGQLRRLDMQLAAAERGELNCQATVTFSTASAHRVQVVEPQLVVKLRAPDKTLTGETVNVLVTVSNPGDGAAEAVRIKAVLPEGLECVRGRIVEMELGTLAPRTQRTVQIACLARASGPGKCTVSASGDGNLTANDQLAMEVLEPKLDLALSGPKLRYIDRPATYVLKVTNPGTGPLQGVAVNQVVPAGFKFQTATGGGRFEEGPRTVAWQIGELAAGQSKELQVELIATTAGDHRLVAQASSTRGVKSEASAQTRIEGSSSLTIELADLDDPVEVGAETAYEIRVSNTGTKTESNLVLICTLPEQVEFKEGRCSAGAKLRAEGREITFEPLPRLAPKADVIYRVTVRGRTAGDARMQLRVRADGMPNPVLREESTRFYSDNLLPR